MDLGLPFRGCTPGKDSGFRAFRVHGILRQVRGPPISGHDQVPN